ncbi:MAG: sugar kinase [Chthoniobacterales bacterium]
MKTTVTFGEVMLRLATPDHLRFAQANVLEKTFGGGEANVAVSLANYGLPARFITRLPKNELGQDAINGLRGLGVDTTKIVRAGERIGIYFLESGAAQRGSNVLYDRANSAISEIKTGEVNWSEVFADAGWFHFTGITPALSDSAAAVCLEAAQAAKAAGVLVSCDLNFRKKLWSSQKANDVMSGLMPYVDYCIANEEDAEKVFGIKAGETEVTSGSLEHDRYVDVARQLTDKFGFKGVAITLRESFSASRNGWSALFYTDGQDYFSRRYEIEIVDRVGGGDSFAGGLIYALLNGKSPADTINFAVAASALKHTVSGDYNLVTLKEVEALVGGDGSGRVQR